MRSGLNETLRALLRKRAILALLVGAAVFGSVYAFAATLSVSSLSLGAGNSSVSTCTSSVTASYSISYDATMTTPGYRVSGITINNISTCSGKTITVDLTGSCCPRRCGRP